MNPDGKNMIKLLSKPGHMSPTKLMAMKSLMILLGGVILILGLMQGCGRNNGGSTAEPTQPEDVTPTHTPSVIPVESIEEEDAEEDDDLNHLEEGLIMTQGPIQGEMIKGGVGQTSTGQTTQYYTPSQPGVEGMAEDVALNYQADTSAAQGQDHQTSEAYYSEGGDEGAVADDGGEDASDSSADELADAAEEFEEPAAWTMLSKAWDHEPCARKARIVSSYGKLCVADRITLFGRRNFLAYPKRKGGSVSMGVRPDHWQHGSGQPGPTKIFHVKSVEINPQRLRLRFAEALNRIIIDGGSTEQRHPIKTTGINFHGSFGAALQAVPATTTISHLASGQHYDMYLNIERRSGPRCLISFALVEARNQKFVGYYYGTSRCYR